MIKYLLIDKNSLSKSPLCDTMDDVDVYDFCIKLHGLDTRRVETFTDIVVDKTLQNNKYMFICGDMIQIVDVVVNTGWLYYSNSVTIINRYTVKQQEFINSTMLDQLLKLDHSNWIKLLTGKESSWKDLMQYMILLSYHKH